jgi:ribose 5-phosphate isomerase B
MKIFIGNDHNGYRYRQMIFDYLAKLGHEAVDMGDGSVDPDDDFPIFAAKVATAVTTDEDVGARGILVCGSGQGMLMAANRFKGARAGLGYSVEAAKGIRNDEDSNIISLPSIVLQSDEWRSILDAWLTTPFAASVRYVRRNKELDQL